VTLAEDYEALRQDAGARIVRRDGVAVRGPDATSYLQGQCSQDVAVLAVGDSVDSLLLSPQGKLDALVRVTRRADDDYLVDVDDGWGPIVAARLERFKLRVKADIADVPLRCLSVRGAAASPPTAVLEEMLSVPFSWGGLLGVDILAPLDDGVGDATLEDVEPTVRRCGPAAWEAVRLEAGIPVMGAELDERTIAAEADLLDRTVSFTKGCYTGQELVARLDARGNKVARRLAGVVFAEGEPGPTPNGPDSGDVAAPIPKGAEVVSGDDVVGAVTSSAWSPELGAVALAYLHRRVTPPALVRVRLPDGRLAEAEARPLPLIG
jgi:folate-binding protein YgfZ